MNCLLRDFVQSGEVEIKTGPFGTQLKASEYVEQGTPVLNVKNLGYSTVVKSKLDRVGPSTIERLSVHILHRGDIVFGRKGAVDRHAYISSDEEGWMQGSDCIRVRVKTEKINPRFLSYYFLTPEHRAFMISMCSHGTTMASLNQKILEMIEVPLPDRSIQDGIVSLLGILDDKIELNQKINENLIQQLASIYKSWYQDFSLTNNDLIETKYGLIPQGWHYSLLGELCQSISVTHKFGKDKLIFLNTGDVEGGHFLHSNFMAVTDMPGQAKKTIAPNDILYSEIRPINRHFAYVNFLAEDYVVSTKFMVIRAKMFDSRRLYHYLTSDDILIELQLQAESRSGTFPQIRFDNVSKLPILIADEQTESAFIDLLHTVYSQIEHINLENEKLANLRDALLPKLMSGEIDVSDIQI